MIQTPDGVTFKDFIVTCHTDGCEAEGLPVQLMIEIGGMLAFCGPCGQQIEDIAPLPDKV